MCCNLEVVEMNKESRLKGALLGLVAGDALSMPVHWYYSTENIKKDYGKIEDMVAPKRNHPER